MTKGIERQLLFFVVIIGLLLIVYIPKKRKRLAHAVFLFQGFLSWILGLAVVEAGLLHYPVREFTVANHTSFVFEYLLFPVTAAYFNLWVPQGSWLKLALYSALFSAAITIPEIFIEKYTRLLNYTGWTWYWTFISVGAALFISRLFALWFFAGQDLKQEDGYPHNP